MAKSPYLIGICHGSDLRQFQSNPRLQPYVKAAIPLLDRIVTSHLEQKNEIAALFDVEEAKILVCGSGFNDRIFNTSGRVHPDNSVVKIVYTGKLSSAKGVFELLAALKTLQTRYSLDLTLIGSSSSEAELSRLDEAIGELAFPVHTTGIIPQAQIAEIYQQSHIFVLPSYYEGMPLTVPEALATGLRVVVTRLPGFEDWLKDFPIPCPCGSAGHTPSMPPVRRAGLTSSMTWRWLWPSRSSGPTSCRHDLSHDGRRPSGSFRLSRFS